MSEDTLEIIESYFSSSRKIGDAGEALTASRLRNECHMEIIRNLYIPSSRHFCEIDMVGISSVGLFVIENKNYHATVEGSKSRDYWIIRYSKSDLERLYNPIKQNEKHRSVVKDLLSSLGLDDFPVYNVVIFNDKARLNLNDCNRSVFSLSSFVEYYNETYKEVTSKELKGRLDKALRPFSDQSDEMHYIHTSLLSSLEVSK